MVYYDFIGVFLVIYFNFFLDKCAIYAYGNSDSSVYPSPLRSAARTSGGSSIDQASTLTVGTAVVPVPVCKVTAFAGNPNYVNVYAPAVNGVGTFGKSIHIFIVIKILFIYFHCK